mgnify:CR=1 FL=1
MQKNPLMKLYAIKIPYAVFSEFRLYCPPALENWQELQGIKGFIDGKRLIDSV